VCVCWESARGVIETERERECARVWAIEGRGCDGREIPSETGFMSSMASPPRRRRKRLAPKDLLRRHRRRFPLSAQRHRVSCHLYRLSLSIALPPPFPRRNRPSPPVTVGLSLSLSLSLSYTRPRPLKHNYDDDLAQPYFNPPPNTLFRPRRPEPLGLRATLADRFDRRQPFTVVYKRAVEQPPTTPIPHQHLKSLPSTDLVLGGPLRIH